MSKNDYPIRDMQNPLSTIILQKSLPADEYYTDINRILMWEASYLQNGNADRLIDLYLQLGLYDEAIPLLEKNDNRAADYYYYRDQVKQDQ